MLISENFEDWMHKGGIKEARLILGHSGAPLTFLVTLLGGALSEAFGLEEGRLEIAYCCFFGVNFVLCRILRGVNFALDLVNRPGDFPMSV